MFNCFLNALNGWLDVVEDNLSYGEYFFLVLCDMFEISKTCKRHWNVDLIRVVSEVLNFLLYIVRSIKEIKFLMTGRMANSSCLSF